jgi:hypothetical protein
LIRATRRAWRERRPAIALVGIGHLVASAAGVYLVFLLLWGLNYRRCRWSSASCSIALAPAADAVVELGLEAVRQMNALHDAAHEAGWVEDQRQNASLRQGFIDVQRSLADGPLAVPGRLKRTVFGPYFRWTSVDGMVNPFWLEVLANPDLLRFERHS